MNISAKNRFTNHYKILSKHYKIDHLPYDPKIRELSKEAYINRYFSYGLSKLTDDDFEAAKSLSIFFDQRDKMNCKEFNKALLDEYGDALNIEKDVREIETFNVLSSIDRNIKTIRGIMVFFLVLWIIGVVTAIIYALVA
ncbi:MAG: hypothetical protein PHE07_01430 [Bacteroidales bacterium]|nr:hypothetical protein [Bacteroidales bacterium]